MSEEEVASFVSLQKRRVAKDPDVDIDWDAAGWEVTAWAANRNKKVWWWFVTDDRTPFDPRFGDVLKAILVHEHLTNRRVVAHLKGWTGGGRVLYAALCGPDDALPADFTWGRVMPGDWIHAMELISPDLATNTRYSISVQLKKCATLLASRGIIPPMDYHHGLKAKRAATHHHIADREAARAKLPPQGALDALADASQHPRDDRDALLFALIKLYLILGLRLQEALTLPFDCLRTSTDGKKYVYVHVEKCNTASPMRWIPTVAVDLVCDAIGTIQRITEDARQRARVLDANTSRILLLGCHDPGDEIGGLELGRSLGYTNRWRAVEYLERIGVARYSHIGGSNGQQHMWRVRDLERALAGSTAIPRHRYVFKASSGDIQPLGDFLCVMPKGFFAGSPNLLIVEPVGPDKVWHFLGRNTPADVPERGSGSMFERYGLIDPNGKP